MKRLYRTASSRLPFKNKSSSSELHLGSNHEDISDSGGYASVEDTSPSLLFSYTAEKSHAPSNVDLFELLRNKQLDSLKAFLGVCDNPSLVVNQTRTIANRTLLHIATITQQPDAIRLLYHYGASLDVRDNTQQTPMHYAARGRKFGFKIFDLETVHALCQAPDAERIARFCRDKNTKTPMDFARENGVYEALEGALQCRKTLMSTSIYRY